MTNLVDRLPLPSRARLSRESTTRRKRSGRIYDLGFMISDLGGACAPSDRLTRNQKSEIRNPLRPGLTLIEMLVALAVTLVMMAAVVNLFANMSASIRNRRAAIETGTQLRQTRNRLAMDLSGATSRGSTWQDPAENQGYIEIIEGEWSDKNPSNLTDGVTGNDELDYTTSFIPSSQAFDPDTGAIPGGGNIGAGAVTDGRALGDWDDVLALTVRSESDPFTARVTIPATSNDVLVESPLAEVFWFARQPYDPADPDPNDGFRRIYRKTLLIAPWLGPWPGAGNQPPNVSVHWDPSQNAWVANTLSDLSKRENRGFRDPTPNVFPHLLDRGRLNNSGNQDSMVLSSSLAFDVRVFDPGAPLYPYVIRSRTTLLPSDSIVEPGDYGWLSAIQEDRARSTPFGPSGYGAFCDLGWNGTPATPLYTPGANSPTPIFGWPRQAGSHPSQFVSNPNSLVGYPAVYDTWSYHYENDGLNQETILSTWLQNLDPVPPSLPNFLAFQTNTTDQGANGLDDDGANGVDDRGERETSPPYDVPLRGVKVILRVYEPDSRQIRESSVTHSLKQ